MRVRGKGKYPLVSKLYTIMHKAVGRGGRPIPPFMKISFFSG